MDALHCLRNYIYTLYKLEKRKHRLNWNIFPAFCLVCVNVDVYQFNSLCKIILPIQIAGIIDILRAPCWLHMVHDHLANVWMLQSIPDMVTSQTYIALAGHRMDGKHNVCCNHPTIHQPPTILKICGLACSWVFPGAHLDTAVFTTYRYLLLAIQYLLLSPTCRVLPLSTVGPFCVAPLSMSRQCLGNAMN